MDYFSIKYKLKGIAALLRAIAAGESGSLEVENLSNGLEIIAGVIDNVLEELGN